MGTRCDGRFAVRASASIVLVAALATSVPGQTTERVNVSSAGVQGDMECDQPSISANDRYVAFYGYATNLVPGDTNGAADVFVRDRHSGTTERISVDSSGAQGNADSNLPTISADGRYVAFASIATNLVPGDTNAVRDVFVRDRQLGTTERVSIDSAGVQGNAASSSATISADGRYVAFMSLATNLVAGDTNGRLDVFVHDRQTGTTERASVDSAGVQGNGDSGSFAGVSISAGGRFVVFASLASNFVAGDTNATWDVFVRDRSTGTTQRMSLDSARVQGNNSSQFPAISADGRYVAFTSLASNLVPGDTNGAQDIFVRDRLSGTTERVSVTSSGVQGNGTSVYTSISAGGRYVAFQSLATNLVPGDTNADYDVFVRDRQRATTERANVDSAGAQGNGAGQHGCISPDGRCVAFDSFATNLVAGDTNGANDVFVRDRGAVPQNFNVDVGSPTAPSGIPASSYGAGANRPGAWIAADAAIGTITTLTDVDGVLTDVTLSHTGGGGDFFFNNAGTSGDDQALMDDAQDVGGAGATTTWTFAGLSNGAYALYTYAWAPDNGTYVSGVSGGGIDPTQNVGGAWPGGQQLGVTFARHRFDVAAGTLAVTIATVTGLGTLNGFQLEKLETPVVIHCSGDGSGTACPCGNAGGAGNGCANSVSPAGAHLAGSGTASVVYDSFALIGSGMPGSSALYFQGTTPANNGAGAVFGDGLRCAAGSIIRLGTKLNSPGGTSQYPAPGDPSISVRGLIPAAGGVRVYQCWYRNNGGPCASGFNLTNGLLVTWIP